MKYTCHRVSRMWIDECGNESLKDIPTYLPWPQSLLGMYGRSSPGLIIHLNEDFELHCEDGPAVIFPEGDKYWMIKGKVIK
jgi:hypothetical protein